MSDTTKKPQIKYIHCRNVDGDGSVMPHGGLTIAYTLNPAFKVVGWAAAKCNIKDTYNKHVGRAKSAGRMLSAAWYQECPEMDEKEFIQQAQEGYHKELA